MGPVLHFASGSMKWALWATFLLAFVTFSYQQVADECDGIVAYVDSDRDGYGDSQGAMLCVSSLSGGLADNNLDCDDSNAQISPAVTEICNQIDDNCNGVIDENACSILGPLAPSRTPAPVPVVYVFPTSYFPTVELSSRRYYPEDTAFSYTRYIPSSGPNIGASTSLVPSLVFALVISFVVLL